MNGQDFSSQLKEEINTLKKAQYFIESNISDDYELNNTRLQFITDKIQKLWTVYYKTLSQELNDVNQDLVVKLAQLKSYNEGIDRAVTSLEQINKMLKFVISLLKVFYGFA
ncbi:hypothetical protein [Acinetobacter oleivorans]